MIKLFFSIFIVVLFCACSSKQIIESKSATVVFKIKQLQFYDKGFITKYKDRINLTIFSFGQVAFKLDLYPDRVCESTFKCLPNKRFNAKYLSPQYNDNFLYTLFQKDSINFKDKQEGIKIKVIPSK
jgi:hypothetical protein